MFKAIVLFSDAVDRWMQRLTGVILVLLVMFVLLQVVARYVFFSPPAWTEELARYAMIWAGLLGATMSFKQRFDPALFGSGSADSKLRVFVSMFIRSATVLIYLTPILWYCFFGPGMNFARGFLFRHSNITADTLEFSTIWVAISVPIAIVVIFIHLAAQWAGDDSQYEPD
jgi:TRAP-type C4-dicarboxylate transport system permease small subunit